MIGAAKYYRYERQAMTDLRYHAPFSITNLNSSSLWRYIRVFDVKIEDVEILMY